MQQLIINGNVGRAPEERFTPNNKKVVSFSLAVSNQDKAKTTTWYECVCWNEKTQDTIMQWVNKGSKLLITGRPAATAYVNKDGNPVATLQMIINTIEFIGSKERGDDTPDVSDAPPAFNAPSPSLQSDDAPF
jgi:single-strand DNA-binding protein